MKKIFVLSLAIASIYFACTPDPKPEIEETSTEPTTAESTPAPVETEPTLAPTPIVGLASADSAKLAEIDEFIQFVIMLQKKEDQGFTREDYKPKGGGERDNVVTIRNKGKVIKSVTALYSDEQEIRDYYHFREGKPLHYKHREWNRDDGNPNAKEVIAYMEGDDVISLQERRINLAPDQKPGAMLRLPLQPSAMNRDSFLQALNKQWDNLKNSADIEGPLF